MSKEVFRVEHLAKQFDGRTVLQDISMSVAQGEVVAIIGPSGSGKTTFLRCCTLLETMDAGTMQFGGIVPVQDGCYAGQAVLRQTKEKFGLVFQNFNLFPHFSVLKNICDAPVHVQKRNPEEVRQEALALLAKMGLAGRENAYPCELSGGQQQRVAIARALAMKPKILFFDEPTSALDPELTSEILKVIRALADENMTMMIVTHEIDFAEQAADRIIFMADGVIAEEGSAAELIRNPKNERTRAFLSTIQNSRR